ncbi:MAG: phosphotransferase [Proteobacteria bacterium]|nr:phosphotransferase [Pseudomonadota bacterium]MBS0573044.1 phosphotransferase [Pseudomonadota bacterium]
MIAETEALDMAPAALAHWRSGGRAPRLVKMRENIVFQVWLADGRAAALRLHRPGYQSRAAITAELDWTAALARGGLRVPEPIAGRDGSWTCEAGGRVASVVGWLEGAAVGAAERPLAGSVREQADLFRRIGALVGGLHRATDALAFDPALTRPSWDVAGLLGEEPLWGRFWDNPVLSEGDRALILRARTEAATELRRRLAEGADFGLIHADVLRENLLAAPGGLALIDFDDSGYGFRLYDLGTALVQSLEEPHLPVLAAALAGGYGAARGIPAPDARDLTLFTLLRCLASLGWIMTRALPDDPRQGLYAGRAVGLARHWLAGTSPLA